MKTQALNPTGLIKQLLDAFFKGPQEVVALFHEQAVIEYPYASTSLEQVIQTKLLGSRP